MMSEMLVSFKNPEEILNFVNTVAKYPYDMDCLLYTSIE